MEPYKKIKISKKPFNDKNKQDGLKILQNTVKKLQNRYNQFGYNDSKEEQFLLENKGKDIVLQLKNKDVVGKLDSIDKYRIGIIQNDKTVYYYKHAIVGYHIE